MEGPDQINYGPYSHTVIAERIYDVPEKSELLFYKGNDIEDRIRHLAPTHQFDIVITNNLPSVWPDTSGNPPNPKISGALYINNNGNVGIGTTSPSYNLDVSGNSHVSGNLTVDGLLNASLTFGNGTETNPSLIFSTDTNTGIYHPADDTLGFVTNGSERIRINSSGNVGIGKTNPGVALDVSGDINASNNIIGRGIENIFGPTNGPTVIGSDPNAYIFVGGRRNVSNRSYIDFQVDASSSFITNTRLIRGLGTNGDFDIINFGTGNLQFGTNATNARVVIDGAGNVGIGTTTPDVKLDVTGYIRGTFVGFHTKYVNSTRTDLGNNVIVKAWDTILHNVGGGWDGSTGYFTAPISGYYTFTAVLYGNGVTANSSFTIRKEATSATSGTEYTGAYQNAPADTGNFSYITATAVIQLNASETVSVWTGIGGVALANNPSCSFCGHLIMPS
jgi:hypothetical protein